MTKPPLKKSKKRLKEPLNQVPKPQFPNNYRFITEYPLLYRGIVGVVYVLLLVGITTVSFNLHESLLEKERIAAQREQIRQEIDQVEQVTREYSGYRDAYLKLAVLQYQLGEFDKARTLAQKSYEIDPNNMKSKELLERLGSAR